MITIRHAAAALSLAAFATPATADDDAAAPVLDLPLACVTGEDCWVAQYVDLDPGDHAHDPLCGPRAYEGHQGVDIAIADMSAMARGVEVRAAAGGVVAGVRDGEPDRLIGEGEPLPAERACGNGVRIEHAGGWSTQYCHMKSGSIAVTAGAAVEAGARLGEVGVSGATQFPHLHVTVRDPHDVVRDPFTGRAPGDGCDSEVASLWRDENFVYQPLAVSRAGFAFGRASVEEAVAGAYADLEMTADAPALVGWGEAWGVRPGDVLEIALFGPDGDELARHADEVTRVQVRRFAFAGVRRPDGGWPAGDYVMEAVLHRPSIDGMPARRRTTLTFRADD